MIHEDIDDQIDQAFANVDHILREAGGKGWEQVFRVNSYHEMRLQKGKEGWTRRRSRNWKRIPDSMKIK